MSDKDRPEKLREFGNNMRGPLSATRRELVIDAATQLGQQQTALELCRKALGSLGVLYECNNCGGFHEGYTHLKFVSSEIQAALAAVEKTKETDAESPTTN